MQPNPRPSGVQSRVKLAPEQLALLNSYYTANPRPSHSERHFMALKLGIADEKVKNWFQNRRAKNKKDVPGECAQACSTLDAQDYPDIYPSCSDLYKNKHN